MDVRVQQIIEAEIIRRRKIAILTVARALKHKQVLSPKRKLWTREWLQRRDTGQNVLNMLFNELGYVSITFSLHFIFNCIVDFLNDIYTIFFQL